MKQLLEQKLAELQAAERQAFANFNAVMGARQFCEKLLEEFSEELKGEENNDAKTDEGN